MECTIRIQQRQLTGVLLHKNPTTWRKTDWRPDKNCVTRTLLDIFQWLTDWLQHTNRRSVGEKFAIAEGIVVRMNIVFVVVVANDTNNYWLLTFDVVVVWRRWLVGLVEMSDCVTRVSTELVSFFLCFLENCNSAKIRCVSSASPTREPKLSAARVFFFEVCLCVYQSQFLWINL